MWFFFLPYKVTFTYLLGEPATESFYYFSFIPLTQSLSRLCQFNFQNMLRIYQLPPPPWPPATLVETAVTSQVMSLGLPPCFSTVCNLCISPSTSFKTSVRSRFFCFSFFSYFVLFPLYSTYSPVVIYLLFMCLLSISSMRSSVRALGPFHSQQKRTVPKTLWNTVYISAVLSPQGKHE